MSKNYEQFLTEQKGGTAVFTFGRFNPPTIGHEKLLKVIANAASKPDADYYVFMSQSNDPKKNPLSHQDKLKFMKMLFPKHRNAFIKSKARNALEAAVQIYDMKKYNKLKMVVGSDRVQDFKKILITYNGVDKRHGFYDFENIEVISAGERDPDAEGVEGMSASKMRAAVAAGDYDTFKMGVPSGTSEKDCHKLWDAIKKGMNIREELSMEEEQELEEALSPSQRRKMGLRMRIQAKKPAFIMKRLRKMKRAANARTLDRRARKQAIKDVVKKYYPKLRGKKTSDLSYAERGKISDIVKKKASIIKRFAKRMIKDVRKKDVERRKSMQKNKDKK